MMTSVIWPFLIYLVIVYVTSYIVVEYGQNYFYDEVTPGAPIKVGLGALILAIIMTKTRPGFATMFTSEIGPTVILAIAWVGVFILIFRFQPWHGFGMAMATLLLIAGGATLVVDSLTAPRPPGRMDVNEEPQKIRRSSSSPTIVKPNPAPVAK